MSRPGPVAAKARSILATGRLQLRWLTIDDAPFMLRIWNDPAFVQFVGDRGLRSEDDARLALQDGPLVLYEAYGYGPYLVSRLSDGAAIGVCGLFRRAGLEHPDIGFALLPEYRGAGLAQEAAEAVVGEARDVLGFGRLTAIVDARNTHSVRLIERLGMRFERVLRLEGDDRDACLYAVDWRRPASDNPAASRGASRVTDGGSVGWRQLREFAGIDVGESYVLSWRLDGDSLLIDTDIKLRPEHPFYEPPKRREKACMRPAVIEFPCCESIRLNGDTRAALPLLVTRLGGGAIRDLVRRDGGPCVLDGEFGEVEIDAGRPVLRLQDVRLQDLRLQDKERPIAE